MALAIVAAVHVWQIRFGNRSGRRGRTVAEQPWTDADTADLKAIGVTNPAYGLCWRAAAEIERQARELATVTAERDRLRAEVERCYRQLDTFGALPELSPEERAAMDALPPDFIKRILRGERPIKREDQPHA